MQHLLERAKWDTRASPRGVDTGCYACAVPELVQGG
jgi:hypothetical protein